jgi:flagellar hook-associated protein 3 FlgL
MLSGLNANDGRFLLAMDQISRRMSEAQRQLSSGLRVSSASDNPDQIGTLLQYHADLTGATQVQSNLGRVTTEANAAEAALSGAVQTLEQVRVLGAQGANGTQTADSRNALAGQVEALLGQLVAASNTSVEGRFLFSGDSDQTAPYTLDLTQANPVSPYAGSPATRKVQDVDGSTIAVARSAQEIFDSATPEDNVFAAVNSLRAALRNNDDQGIADSLAQIGSAEKYLNRQLAFYGSVQNQVSDAKKTADARVLQLQTQISGLQDADLTSAILELNEASTQQQAALGARGRMPNTSLFDYLR